jgi:nucleotide-binding universal stress UspA family protein
VARDYRLAESLDVDLIAFAARRKSLLARTWGHDTVNRVLAHVHRPVLLVGRRTPPAYDRLAVYTPERRAPLDRLLHGGIADRALAQCSGPVVVAPRATGVNG